MPSGASAGFDRDVAVGHYKPINSDRFVNDCHEFIFHFTPAGRTPARPARGRRALSGPLEHQALGGGRRRPALPRQHLVHPLRDDSEPRPRPAAPGVVPAEGARAVPEAARRWRAPASCSIRSSAWAHRRSPRPGWASTSSGSRWTTTTSRKPSSASKRSTKRRRTKKARRGDLGHHVALGLLSRTSDFWLRTSTLPRISPWRPAAAASATAGRRGSSAGRSAQLIVARLIAVSCPFVTVAGNGRDLLERRVTEDARTCARTG